MTGILNGFAHSGAHNGSVNGLDHSRDQPDAQMDQIRDLLFGSVRNELLARFDALEQRVIALEHGLADARRADEAARRAAFDTLAQGVTDLGAEIRLLAKS